MKAFECKMCGECCYGEGGITVDDEEINRITFFLDMDRESFISGYCYKKNNRTYIKTGQDGFCIFFHKEKNCLVHSVKPEICDLWPFYPANLMDKENWELAKDACPGINPHASFEEFVKQSKEDGIN